MEDLPVYIHIIFVLTTALAIFLFLKSLDRPQGALLLFIAWLAIQTLLSLNGFYQDTSQTPPRFLLLLAPPLLLMLILFFSAWGKDYLSRFSIKYLTLLHIVRVPVELVLLLLSINRVVPELMTFEGRNFDIISGITAPLIYYFGFVKKQLSIRILLLWNVFCLLLLFNIVIHAILSAPFPFQQLAFTQPNMAVLYFPFTWLPGVIVPLVLFAHLVTIRKLLTVNGEY